VEPVVTEPAVRDVAVEAAVAVGSTTLSVNLAQGAAAVAS
jgi:hypothetical protein